MPDLELFAIRARPLQGERVLVIGGSSGIGLATARAALEAGAAVFLAARSLKRLIAAQSSLNAAEGMVRVQQLDLADSEMIERALAAIGPVDHLLLTGAGSHLESRVIGAEDAAIQAAFEARLLGAVRVARLAEIGRSLTFVSGAPGRRPQAGRALIAALNAGLEGLTRGLALDLAPVRVNCLSPGLIDTPAYDSMPPAERAEMMAEIAERLPVGRVGRPEDVAAAALLLMTNPYITGTVLEIDGGWPLSG